MIVGAEKSEVLHQLFGVPMTEITDRAFDARSALGRAVTELEQKLAKKRAPLRALWWPPTHRCAGLREMFAEHGS